MTKLSRQILSVLSSGALLLNVVTPVSAITLEVSGNGSDSTSEIKLDVDQETTVVQSNVADVFNKVEAEADTGGNDAEDNTGGDVSIDTGDATTEVKVENTLNSNTASVDCCPTNNDVDVLISGNGTDTNNTVDLDINDNEGAGTSVYQTNYANVTNLVEAEAETAWNDAEDNTGGDVKIETGDADTSVTLSTTANANWARVGGGEGEGGSVSLRILGNGSDSDNDIKLDLDSYLAVVQSNVADVFNKVDAEADTGGNDADDNTGGAVSIDTGDAEATVEVDNMVNFNWADVDCGCLFDVFAKIAGNGTDSNNDIKAFLDDTLEVFQGNCDPFDQWEYEYECELENIVDADADTGENDAEDNTGEPGEDPSVETGDAEAGVDISNAGNSNVFGSESPSEWPEFDFNFNLSLSWSDLLALLGL